MISTILKNYSSLVALVNVSQMTTGKLQAIAKIAGYNVDTGVAEFIVDILKNGAEKYKTTSLIQLMSQEEIAENVNRLIDNVASASDQSSSSNNVNGKMSIDQLVHPDTVIRCPHCDKRVHIRSALERDD